MELGEEKIKSIKERENEEQPEEQVEEKEEKSSKDFEAIITCPECQSKWKLKDNTIVLYTTKENEDEQDK
jgi:predicted  nucleic acid-binding Zn ribbon protein